MRVNEVMSSRVETIGRDAAVVDAARAMAGRQVGFLPVVHDEIAVGVVTDRDITVRVVAAGLDPGKTTVAEIMSEDAASRGEPEGGVTSGLVMISEEADVEDAIRVMEQHRVRRIVVHDADYRVVGVVSLADLAEATGRALSIP